MAMSLDSEQSSLQRQFVVDVHLKRGDAVSEGGKATVEESEKSEVISVKLTHKDSLSVFAGEFGKEELIKAGFDTRSTLADDLKLVRDAMVGAAQDLCLDFGFRDETDGTATQPDWFEGSVLSLCIRESIRGRVYAYSLALGCHELGPQERQDALIAALRQRVADLELGYRSLSKRLAQFEAGLFFHFCSFRTCAMLITQQWSRKRRKCLSPTL